MSRPSREIVSPSGSTSSATAQEMPTTKPAARARPARPGSRRRALAEASEQSSTPSAAARPATEPRPRVAQAAPGSAAAE
ncbi:hypothetical protein [Streptomyces sp. NPDC059814]|uniref:hypothetical protein n=1 Tax=Streptomyces sp. NPDC059814 TaxID=3346959 RepID=UPI00365B885B